MTPQSWSLASPRSDQQRRSTCRSPLCGKQPTICLFGRSPKSCRVPEPIEGVPFFGLRSCGQCQRVLKKPVRVRALPVLSEGKAVVPKRMFLISPVLCALPLLASSTITRAAIAESNRMAVADAAASDDATTWGAAASGSKLLPILKVEHSISESPGLVSTMQAELGCWLGFKPPSRPPLVAM